MNLRILLIAGLLGLINLSANAQVVNTPFYNNNGNNGAMLYRPQIDTVQSGVLHSVQATVSADRKYVTLTATPQLSNVVSINTFTFQTAGNVGNTNTNNNGTNNTNNTKNANNVANAGNGAKPAAAMPAAAVPLLERPGMVKLAD